MTRERLSICFADISHWLKLTRAVGDERAVEVLQELLKFAGDVILTHGGTIRKYIGDAVLFTFPTPPQAVSAAREMVQYRKEVEGVDLRFHVSIAAGEVLLTQIGHPSFLLEDVMGETVNRAALLLREAGKTETGIAMCEATKQAMDMLE